MQVRSGQARKARCTFILLALTAATSVRGARTQSNHVRGCFGRGTVTPGVGYVGVSNLPGVPVLDRIEWRDHCSWNMHNPRVSPLVPFEVTSLRSVKTVTTAPTTSLYLLTATPLNRGEDGKRDIVA